MSLLLLSLALLSLVPVLRDDDDGDGPASALSVILSPLSTGTAVHTLTVNAPAPSWQNVSAVFGAHAWDMRDAVGKREGISRAGRPLLSGRGIELIKHLKGCSSNR